MGVADVYGVVSVIDMRDLCYLFAVSFVNIVQAQEGIPPIPADDLYGPDGREVLSKDLTCHPKNIRSNKAYLNCLNRSDYHKDYGCRYYPNIRSICHCCGQIYHYIEHKEVCTKFCLDEDYPSRSYGQSHIIIQLPFNWGYDLPDRITLENGTNIPVKCDQLDGKAFGCDNPSNGGFRYTTNKDLNINIKTKRTTSRPTFTRRKQNLVSTRKTTLPHLISPTKSTSMFLRPKPTSLSQLPTTTSRPKTTTRQITTRRTTTRRASKKPSRILFSGGFVNERNEVVSTTYQSTGRNTIEEKSTSTSGPVWGLESKKPRTPKINSNLIWG